LAPHASAEQRRDQPPADRVLRARGVDRSQRAQQRREPEPGGQQILAKRDHRDRLGMDRQQPEAGHARERELIGRPEPTKQPGQQHAHAQVQHDRQPVVRPGLEPEHPQAGRVEHHQRRTKRVGHVTRRGLG